MLIKGEFTSRRVWLDGVELLPDESQKVYNHSPGGFCWGYGGSGPSQLALAILLKVADKSKALTLYQNFKWAFIARLPQDDFEGVLDIEDWLRRNS